MKKKEWALQRLEQLIESDLEYLTNIMILQDNGVYHVFGKYVICPIENSTFQVFKNGLLGREFSTLRYALSWCIADKHNNADLANDIQHLDEQRIRVKNDVTVRSTLAAKITDISRREITQVKILARKQELKAIENRLTKCVSLAKYCQIRGFNRDETARTRRTQQTR